MACKYKKDLNDNNFCLKTCYYCTYEQEKTCKDKVEEEKELKPCPFCGGEADYRKSRINSQDVVYIFCKDCHTRTNLVFLDKPHWHIGDPINRYTVQEAKAIATEAWNGRADNG